MMTNYDLFAEEMHVSSNFMAVYTFKYLFNCNLFVTYVNHA